MGWFTSGSSCRGNRAYQCTYETFDTEERFCRDKDYCTSVDDNAGLISVKRSGSSGGGGW